MRLVVFDIDGTLTRTTGVDDGCFVRAMEAELGVSGFDADWGNYPHCTDPGLTMGICRLAREAGGLGREATADEIERVRRRFIALLEQEAAESPGRFGAVRGSAAAVGALLEAGWGVALATGAWRESAMIKLRTSGVLGELEARGGVPAAFAGEPTGDGPAISREAIVGLAVRRAGERWARRAWRGRVVCVGDGVWDARTARRLGYGFVGVRCEGDHRVLEGEGASDVITDYSDVDRLVRAVERATAG